MQRRCKYFNTARGCNNGDLCRYEHIPNTNGNANMSSNSYHNNRFSALQTPSATAGPSRDGRSGFGGSPAAKPFAGLDHENLRKDLSTEKPQWILSCYGPAKDAPEQLFGGPLREHSFEEIRLKHYTSTNPQQTVQEVNSLIANSEQQMQVALNDLDGAIKFIQDARDKHPNRNDIVTAINSTGTVADPGNPLLNTTSAPAPSGGAFGAPSPANNAFKSTSDSNSLFSGGGGAFGKPAFGAPTAPASTGAFGQPSMPGAKPNPFATASSAFGQPSSLGGGGAFGQPSALGPKPNPFGAPTSAPAFQSTAAPSTAPSGFSTFATGAPNGFSTGSTANPFVQNATPAFGQPTLSSAPLNAPTGPSSTNVNSFAAPMSQPKFGQPTQPAFGQPSGGFGRPSSGGGAFGQPSTGTGAFGQPSTGTGAFGQPSSGTGAFGQPSSGTGAFGQPSTGTSAFGQPSSGTGAFGQPSTTGAFGQPSLPANPLTNGNNNNGFATPNPFSSNPNPTPPSQFQSQPPNQQQNRSQPATNSPYAPNAKHTHPPLHTYTTRSASNQLTSFKSHRVNYNPNSKAYEYRDTDGKTSKVLFPDGPPGYYGVTEEAEEVYEKERGMVGVWERFREMGGPVGWFDGVGGMPMVAPRREWCLWDF